MATAVYAKRFRFVTFAGAFVYGMI